MSHGLCITMPLSVVITWVNRSLLVVYRSLLGFGINLLHNSRLLTTRWSSMVVSMWEGLHMTMPLSALITWNIFYFFSNSTCALITWAIFYFFIIAWERILKDDHIINFESTFVSISLNVGKSYVVFDPKFLRYSPLWM